LEVAREYGMHCLVEIFDEGDWEKIKGLPVEIVGINSRDLRNFHTNFERIIRLRDLLPEDILIVAESGVRERKQIERLKEAGIRAVLIGEALMRAKEVKDKLKELMGEC
jgi:indole-3-glycerol phosphate synthase